MKWRHKMAQRLINANALIADLAHDATYDRETVAYYIEQVNEAPAIEPEQWVPVSERLPENNVRVEVFRPCMVDSDTGPVSVQWGWCCKKKEITHWRAITIPPQSKEISPVNPAQVEKG